MTQSNRKPVTVRTVQRMKQSGNKISMMTAYDFPTAKLLDEAGMHLLLVGDSLGMTVQGQATTLSVTLDQMVYHTTLVSRAAATAMVIADLPFMTYQISPSDAMRSAGRLVAEGGATAVKLEGGADLAPTIARLVAAGIPVMAHIGMTPQSVHAFGGFTVQGRTPAAARQLLADALAVEAAGAFAVVLEIVPDEVAAEVTKALTIPTIGIGAGPQCDGQVLVFHDFAGLTSGYVPKHNRKFADLASILRNAAQSYIAEVAAGSFPGEAQTVHLSAEEQPAVAESLQ